MKEYKLALIGFGNVGQGLAQILQDKGKELSDTFGTRFKIVAVSDLYKGSVYNPDGLSPEMLLNTVKNGNTVESIDCPQKGWDAMTTIQKSNADIIVEMSYTDLKSGEPAASHIKAALSCKKHVVTTNKGPVALDFAGLQQLAAENGVEIGVEGTVMSGTPAIRLGMEFLKAAKINKIMGILNGTTNFILTQMSDEDTYDEALKKAQELGFAEADPTGDVEGFDAAAKVVILANLLMNTPINLSDVQRQGITKISADDVFQAHENGKVWKLVGSIEKTPSGVRASVKPECLRASHPLASVSGATNAVTYSTGLLGDVTLIGPGAGRTETGYALILDMLAIHKQNSG